MSTETTTYLAMTAAEFTAADPLPPHPAWMACHFSAYSTGLSNCPMSLPEGAVLMVNDRTPIWYHDPARILMQLQQMQEEFSLSGIILDFQRPDYWETEQLVGILTKELACPVAVSEHYAKKLACPVFLSPLPLYIPLGEHLRHWEGRDIWLEAICAGEVLTVDAEGCTEEELMAQPSQELPFEDPKLFCRYAFTVSKEKAEFTLYRSIRELESLMEQAASLGVSKFIGLYQQFSKK